MKAVIFDIDRTLADCSHREHLMRSGKKDFYEFYKLAKYDKPKSEIVEILNFYREAGYKIILCTGRPKESEERDGKRICVISETIDWLLEHGINYDALYFRGTDCHHHDDVIKRDAYREMLEDGYEPKIVFEDRSRVVKMWRELGLTCLQVDDGDF